MEASIFAANRDLHYDVTIVSDDGAKVGKRHAAV
jgi:hypothetical protein